MRVGLIGCGVVAAIHAAQLKLSGASVSIAYSPDADEAARFAATHHIPIGTADLAEAFQHCDAVIIASPSQFHFAQSLGAIESGRHALVEIPACGDDAEAQVLRDRAIEKRVVLQCTHTSRYLEPYLRITKWIHSGQPGEIRHIGYTRRIARRKRGWLDDALAHHAAHPLDLLLWWFDGVEPVAGVAVEPASHDQCLSLLGRLPNGAPVSLTVLYESLAPLVEMSLIGSKSAIVTDGFSYVQSDGLDMASKFDAEESYHRAVAESDRAFVSACAGLPTGVAWQETSRLVELISRFRRIRPTQTFGGRLA